MKISLNRINKDYLFEATSSNELKVLMDNKSKKEGKVEGISPMEVLLMGVAGCSSIDVVAILNKQRINPVTLKMEVEGIRDADARPIQVKTQS
jgi:putative redox protein